VTVQPWYSERFVCCVARSRWNSRGEIEQIKAGIQPRAAAMGIKVIMYGDEGANPLQEVSSHEIRKAIAMQHWDLLRDNGWLPPPVLRRLQSGQQ
jgi:hypothetical protein